MKTKITAPVVGYSGVGAGGLVFTDGVAQTDNPAVIDYCRQAGYQIGDEPVDAPLTADEINAVIARARREQPDLSDDDEANAREELTRADAGKVRAYLEAPVDARAVDGPTVVGTPLRDAAVDPRPGDFLAPTNAGKADPHGPLVVAPGIHAVESQVVRPGQVFVNDLAAQDAAETAQAVALLVENQTVGEALPSFERAVEADDAAGVPASAGSDTGPLGLSDPGSVVAIETGNAADEEQSTLPDGTSAEPPTASASKGAWTAYARSQGATDDDLEGKTRDQIREAYAPLTGA